jgi:hypothetical protein
MVLFGYLFLALAAALLIWGLSVEARDVWHDLRKR